MMIHLSDNDVRSTELTQPQSMMGKLRMLISQNKYALLPLIFILLLYVRLGFPCGKKVCPINLTQQLIGDGGDSYEYFGFMYLTKQNILEFKHPFADTDIFRYPDGFNYSFGFDGAFPNIVGAVLSFVFPLSLSYNITILIILLCNIYLSAFCFRKIGLLAGRPDDLLSLKSYLAGIMFGLCAYVMSRINGHLNLSFISGFACLGLAMSSVFWKIHTQQNLNSTDISFFPIAFLLLAIGSLEYLAFAILLLPPLALYLILKRAIFWKELQGVFSNKNERNTVILVSVGCLAIFFYLFFGFIQALLNATIFFRSSIPAQFPGKNFLIDLITPKNYIVPLLQGKKLFDGGIERSYFLGLSWFVLAVEYLFLQKKGFIGGVFITLLLYILFLYSGFLPFPMIFTGRFSLLLILLMAIAFVVHPQFGWKTAAVVVCVMFLEQSFMSFHLTPPLAPALAALKNEKGAAIITIPIYPPQTFSDILPSITGKKVTGGYFHWTANTARANSFITNNQFALLSCKGDRNGKLTSLLPFLREMDVSVLLIDLGAINRYACDMNALFSQIKQLEREKLLQKKFSNKEMEIYIIPSKT